MTNQEKIDIITKLSSSLQQLNLNKDECSFILASATSLHENYPYLSTELLKNLHNKTIQIHSAYTDTSPKLLKNPIEEVLSANGSRILRYEQKYTHTGLNETKIISGASQTDVRIKGQEYQQKIHSKWTSVKEKTMLSDLKQVATTYALEQTKFLESFFSNCDSLLKTSLNDTPSIDWESRKLNEIYTLPEPNEPTKPVKKVYPKEPNKRDPEFQVRLSLLDKIFYGMRKQKEAYAANQFDLAHKRYKKECEQIDKVFHKEMQNYEEKFLEYQQQLEQWNQNKNDFYKAQDEYNQLIDEDRKAFENLQDEAVQKYFEDIIRKSCYLNITQKEFEIIRVENTKTLLVDMILPDFDEFPTIKDLKVIASRFEFKPAFHSASFIEKAYEDMIYKHILSLISNLFRSDIYALIDAISFNGWINHINKSTGKEETLCITSIQVKKDAFNDIDLSKIEAKTCFKSLRGVSSSKLASITPIQPILSLNKDDKRFVSSYDVTTNIDNSTNLASMTWEDFEHLIREIFEKEFSSNGGEVKVTQASRDGGVDAIAFDPDPIRGGKIVIQAKRYTNTVGVSAVRDLYGTVMNEGATKGILVTTSDYGPDAYEFASNKPITLLNGANLLYLLERHGHKARIDLLEAKAYNIANK